MRASIRVLLMVAAGILLALGAWSGVKAAGGPQGLTDPFFKSAFVSRVFGGSTGISQVETVMPEGTGTPEAGEDRHPDDQGPVPMVTGTPQMNGNDRGQNEEVSAPAAMGTSHPESNGEVTGSITAIDASTITIDGVVYNLSSTSETKGSLQVGSTVKLEFITNPDGTLSVTEVKVRNGHDGSESSGSSGSDSSGDGQGGSNSGGNSGGDQNGSPNSSGNSGGDGHGGSGGSGDNGGSGH